MSRDRQPLMFKRVLGALRPANEAAEAALRSIPEGGTIIGDLKRSPRNVRRHKLYWKILDIAAENLADRVDGPLDSNLLHELVKQRLGLGEWVTLPSGDRLFKADSTAFHAMPENEFVQHFDRVNGLLAKWLGVDPAVLMDEAKQEAA